MSDRPNTPPMRKYYCVPFKQTFEEIGEGIVRVTDQEGKSGVFTWQGEFIEGDLTTVNKNMLIWAGGPNIPKEMNFRWIDHLPAIDRESGWPEHMEPYVQKALGKR